MPAHSETPLQNEPYPRGHVLHLTGLPRRPKKPALTAFLAHNVSAHERAAGRSIATPQLKVAHITLCPSAEDAAATSATVRMGSEVDAGRVAVALRERRRMMRGAEDGKGCRVQKGEGVLVEVLAGERERIVWEELREEKAKKELRKRRRKEGRVVEIAADPETEETDELDYGDGHAKDIGGEQRESRFFRPIVRSAGKHIRFET